MSLLLRKLLLVAFILTGAAGSAFAQTDPNDHTPYGDNKQAGAFAQVGDAKIYYEIYGSGVPMVILHGNRGSISVMHNQISYFSKKYKVIAIDSRGCGKSQLGKDSLTYDNMANDVAAILSKLNIDSTYIIGYSDGAIVGLTVAMKCPDKVKKMVSFGGNVQPDTNALNASYVIDNNHKRRIEAEQMLAKGDTTKDWYFRVQCFRLIEFQPKYTAEDLHKIKAHVMVMSTDRDIVKEEHTLFIYRNIPKSSLCIIPGEPHGLPRQNPALFNMMVDTFFSKPYTPEN